MKINIRDSLPQDATSIYNIRKVTWLATYPNNEAGISYDDINDLFPVDSENEAIKRISNYTGCLEDRCSLVAEVDGKVVGFAYITKTATRNNLQAIYILSDYQGKGVGHMFMQKIDKWFDSTKDTYLSVATYNQNAINFYTNHGFKIIGKKENNSEVAKLPSGKIIPEYEMVKSVSQ